MNLKLPTFNSTRRVLWFAILILLPFAGATIAFVLIPPTHSKNTFRPTLSARDKREQIVDALKLHAEAFDGRFPDSLYGDYLIAKVWAKLDLPKTVGHSPRAGFAHLTVLKREEPTFRYYGQRVLFGEGDRVLLHWSTQADTNTVVFGNLTCREVNDVDLASVLNPWNDIATNCIVRVMGGSGVVISPDGLIVTANHVLHNADSATIRYHDDRVARAIVVDRSVRLDVALLRCEVEAAVPFVEMETNPVLKGESLWAIGYPQGSTAPRIRESSSYRYVLDELITTQNRDILGGDSGGAFINRKGKLVGVILGPGDGHLSCIRSASCIGIRNRWPDEFRQIKVSGTNDFSREY